MVLVYYKWLMTGILALLHPFFVGVTEIQHNAKDKTLEISVKVFAEDFEKTLTQVNKIPVDLVNPKDQVKANKLVATYLQQHLVMKVNGKPVQLEFVGYEKEREAVWCFVQVINIPVVSKIDITNSLLYDAFEQQINLIHVTVNGERKSTKLSFPDQEASFAF